MNIHYPQISPISKFAIYGLYGDRDIVIPFPYPRKILVSENGWGKTTVLNTLYVVLTGRFFKKLERLPFNQIQVTFDNGSVSISKADLESLQSDELRKDKYSTFAQQLRENFPIEVLYFTTYRQIEEGLQNLDYRPTDLQLPSGLIQSGMDDVRSKIGQIEGIAFEHQLSPENLLEEFTGVCNRYLIDKQLVYVSQTEAEATTWDLEVRTKKNRVLPLELLSSGEKHIISTFSYMYLRPPRRCAVLIDEPELSISVEWQRQLLPDLLKARHCCFLMAATHSPFIFDNELATNTVDLQEYIREYE